MPSPFPGMDPYLEHPGAWHDFHEQFCIDCRAQLTPKLGPSYVARLDENVYIHELSADERRLMGRPDVFVAKQSGEESIPADGTASVAAPVVGRVETAVDVERQNFIEIRDSRSRRLITVIEILSPSNKNHGSDREQYLKKRREILSSDVHLVEIDLLRAGPRMPVDELPECDYCVMVSRAEDRPDVGLWPLKLRDPLPAIPIPLADTEESVTLDLRAALDASFLAAGYANYIYHDPPDPPLVGEDSDWADQLVAAIR